MNHFLRVIRISLRYKWSLIGSMVCALAIACLWGFSIWSVYPFVEVVFEGNTIPMWMDTKIATSSEKVEKLSEEIAALREEMDAESPAGHSAILGKIALRTTKLTAHEKSLEFYRSLQPSTKRWAPTTPFGTLALLMGLLLVAEVIKGIFLVLNNVLVARISSATTLDLRRIFFREMLRMDQQKIDYLGTTNLMTMVSRHVSMIQAGLRSIYGRSIREPFKLLACLAIACAISWQLLLLSMLLVPLGGITIVFLGRQMKRAMGGELVGYAAVLRIMLETLNGIKDVRIFSGQRRERHRFKMHANTLKRMALKITFFDSLLRPISEIMSVVVLATAILCGAYLVLNQKTHLLGIPMSAQPLSIAELIAFFAMLAGIADPARKMSGIYNLILRAVTASQSLFAVVDSPPKIVAPPDPKPTPHHRINLRFENVFFGYGQKPPVLSNINLEIPFGQTVALTGMNGSGKSSLANLIPRFYDPRRGRILLDNVDLRDLRPQKLWQQIGIVSQDPFLFHGTIESNIRYGKPRATDAELQRAIELSCVNEILPQLADGLQTEVGERGSQVSGGQRQRIALARAILSDPSILILDEATSQLDTETEDKVLESLRDFVRQRTTILITHRVSTLAIADRIIVLRNGVVAEDMPTQDMQTDRSGFTMLLAKAA